MELGVDDDLFCLLFFENVWAWFSISGFYFSMCYCNYNCDVVDQLVLLLQALLTFVIDTGCIKAKLSDLTVGRLF